jgi:ribosome-binding protein aMBF1 (putative translation factor)
VLRRDARAKKLPTLTERGRVSSGLRAERYRRLGDALSAARIAAGIRQRDLARALRKPQSFVSKYERASRRLDVIEFLCVTSLIGASALEVLAAVMEAD